MRRSPSAFAPLMRRERRGIERTLTTCSRLRREPVIRADNPFGAVRLVGAKRVKAQTLSPARRLRLPLNSASLAPMEKDNMPEVDRTPERLLLIGCKSFVGVDAVAWHDRIVPNIPDYDLVVVSVPHITEEFLQSLDSDVFDKMKESLVRFLHSGGKLVVLLSPIQNVRREGQYPEWISNIDWCPVGFATPEEAGTSIVQKWDRYSTYLQKMRSWSFYVAVPKNCLSRELTNFYGSTHETAYRVPLEPYVENRYSRTLAGECVVEIRKQRKSGDGWGNVVKEYPNEPDVATGTIVVLPLIDGITPEEALLDILKQEVGYSLRSPAPDWAQAIPMPCLPELREEIRVAEDKIEVQRGNIAALQDKINGITGFLRLLYGTGTELEDVTQSSFELLGAKVMPAKYSQEEYILVVEGKEYLMEVKGVSKSISLTHLRQLNDYLLKYQEDTGKDCKGILLGNAWRNMPPDMRNGDETPEFPDNVVKRAEQWGIALVSSRVLFDAVLHALTTSTKPTEFIEAVTTTNGVVNI